MQDILKLPATKIFHNASYDVGWLLVNGFEIRGQIVDTMIAAALINENRFSFSLNACAKDYLGEIKNETFLNEKAKEWGIDPKADLWRFLQVMLDFMLSKMQVNFTFMGKIKNRDI